MQVIMSTNEAPAVKFESKGQFSELEMSVFTH